MSPLRILLAKDEVRAVETMLSQLPERTQEILVAIRVEGSSLKSLANRYNISTSAIEKHVPKAAKALSVVRRSDLVAAHRNGVSPQRQKLLRSEEHTSELQSLMRISYAVFRWKKKKTKQN